jgi:hypothetical protein
MSLEGEVLNGLSNTFINKKKIKKRKKINIIIKYSKKKKIKKFKKF